MHGLVIGFISAMPSVGPVGILSVQRTLSKGQKSGFFSGLGSATADLMYAAIALLSVAAISQWIENNKLWITIVGGLAIMVFGIIIFLNRPDTQMRRNRSGQNQRLWLDYISTFFITITNPAVLATFIGLFAVSGESDFGSFYEGLLILIGVFAGAASWWFLFTFIISLFRGRIKSSHLTTMNRITGSIIVFFGLLLMALAVYDKITGNVTFL